MLIFTCKMFMKKIMQEKIHFKSAKDINICGILSNPKENIENPIVILCHGFATDKESYTNSTLEMVLNGSGIATLRFDFFGHGESDGEFEKITLSQGVMDIVAAYEYLRSLGYEKIALVGSSFGGAAAILASVQLPDIFALALKCPVSDYEELEIERKGEAGLKEWRETGFEEYESDNGKSHRVNYSFYEDLKNNNGLDMASEILTPTLIVHGDADEDVPVSQSIRLSQKIEDCNLEIFPGADHRFSNEDDFKKMIQLIAEFIIRQSD